MTQSSRLRGAWPPWRAAGVLLLLSISGCREVIAPAAPRPSTPRAIFSAPIAGVPGTDLFYGAYRDQGGRDYQCGGKFYNGHAGVDILLRDFRAQDSGVAVLAAAPGRVTNVRDGMFDRNTQLEGGGFGNFVAVLHDDPTVTSIYAHLRNGSVRVQPGAQVGRGDTLGFVGSSGNSNWPHLHFEVRENGMVVDPFIGPCNEPAGQAAWLDQLPYQNEFRVLDVGLVTNQVPSIANLLERPADSDTVSLADDTFFLWLSLFNVRAAAIRTVLRDSGGAVLSQSPIHSMATYSVALYAATFNAVALRDRGRHAVVVYMTPLDGTGEREIARREFFFDPGVAPGGADRVPRSPDAWISAPGRDHIHNPGSADGVH